MHIIVSVIVLDHTVYISLLSDPSPPGKILGSE